MSPGRRFGREQLAAIALASILVLVGTQWWRRSVATREPCCAAESSAPDSLFLPDPYLHSGRLANGLKYYIRANSSPKQRADLRLVVDVGSVVEADDERGLAHAVEHMLFRGTRHFPRRAIQDYLESIGMRNGEDLNAHTSRDETTFELRVPTDQRGVLDTAIAMLADMAHEATFDPAEARVEAGIVLAEWRSSRSAIERVSDRRDSIIMSGSRYGVRSPIGDTTVIRRFDVSSLRRFYQRWYRPDRMAIIVVGDLDPLEIERSVKRYFGAIAAASAAPERPTFTVPPATALRAFTLSDPEVTATELSIWIPRRAIHRATKASYSQRLLVGLWQSILDDRLSEVANEPDSPILAVEVSQRRLARELDAEVVSATVPEGMENEAVTRVIAEITHLIRSGPSEDEVKRQVDATLRMRRETARWADDTDELALGYRQEFLAGDKVLTRDASLQLATGALSRIGVEDVAAAGRRLSLDSGAFVFLTPAVGSHTGISSESLARLVSSGMGRDVRHHEERADPVALVTHAPAPGAVRAERPLVEVGAYDWTLSNGMRLILKPTRFSYDRLQFRLGGPGGASLAADADFPSAFYADEVIRATGIGDLTGHQLKQRLDASSIELSLNVNDAALELTGIAATDDLELLFQLLHLYFTSPRVDTLAFRRWMARRVALATRREGDPDSAFEDTLASALSQRHARALRFDRAFVRRVELPRVLDFWRARTANAANFTLVLTGDFTLDRVRTLAERYLAGLPAGVHETPRDDGMRFPASAITRSFRAGAGPKARTSIVLSNDYELVEGTSEELSIAREAAELALEERLRENLGATYGVHVSASLDMVPPFAYRVTIEFESDPRLTDSLSMVALRELDRLHTEGPTVAEATKIRASHTRDLDDKINENAYWADELVWHSRPGLVFTSITSHQSRARALTIEEVRDACAKYLGTSRRVHVTMYPRRPTTHPSANVPSTRESSVGGAG